MTPQTRISTSEVLDSIEKEIAIHDKNIVSGYCNEEEANPFLLLVVEHLYRMLIEELLQHPDRTNQSQTDLDEQDYHSMLRHLRGHPKLWMQRAHMHVEAAALSYTDETTPEQSDLEKPPAFIVLRELREHVRTELMNHFLLLKKLEFIPIDFVQEVQQTMLDQHVDGAIDALRKSDQEALDKQVTLLFEALMQTRSLHLYPEFVQMLRDHALLHTASTSLLASIHGQVPTIRKLSKKKYQLENAVKSMSLYDTMLHVHSIQKKSGIRQAVATCRVKAFALDVLKDLKDKR